MHKSHSLYKSRLFKGASSSVQKSQKYVACLLRKELNACHLFLPVMSQYYRVMAFRIYDFMVILFKVDNLLQNLYTHLSERSVCEPLD